MLIGGDVFCDWLQPVTQVSEADIRPESISAYVIWKTIPKSHTQRHGA